MCDMTALRIIILLFWVMEPCRRWQDYISGKGDIYQSFYMAPKPRLTVSQLRHVG